MFQDAVARREAVKSEISSVLRPFYCEVCEKQFQNVAQYDEHTNSYAHHHKVRFRDMQAAQRASRNTEEEVNKRKEKERKREEKELRKIAKAAGVKMTKPAAPLSAVPPAGESSNSGSGFKKSGWATLATPPGGPSATPSEPPNRSGWATVGASPSQPPPSSAPNRGGWAPVSAPPPPPVAAPPPPAPSDRDAVGGRGNYSAPPSFRTGGWTSLETSSAPPPHMSSQFAPPPPPPDTALAPPPPEPQQGWTSVPKQADTGSWRAVPPTPSSFGTASSAKPTIVPSPAPVQQEPQRQEPSRSGWQKFRAGAPGRRR